MIQAVTNPEKGTEGQKPAWSELFAGDGSVRPLMEQPYSHLQNLRPPEIRILQQRMEAILREMGVTLDVIRSDPWGAQPWQCDLLPHIFDPLEWTKITKGVVQRLEAFEHFLRDIYGSKEILKKGIIPIQPVLGSPHYQAACIGLPRTDDCFLHLSSLCLARDARGELFVKRNQFADPSGIAYMMQNRRALARVTPDIFEHLPVESVAEIPQAIMEALLDAGPRGGAEPAVVLLSPGPSSPLYPEHSFLARRMGAPLAQGGDLLVLDDCLFLKTVQGLNRVDVVYSLVPDSQLDSLVFRKDSVLGVPGLVHCLRQGTVSLINSIGSEIADDPSLLCFDEKIIRFYLGEDPILPSLPAYWLGDLDQLEMVLEKIDHYDILPVSGEEETAPDKTGRDREEILQALKRRASHYVARPKCPLAQSVCYENGKKTACAQEHLIFALRSGGRFNVFPGSLTRTEPKRRHEPGRRSRGGSKDSWVLTGEGKVPVLRPRTRTHVAPLARQVTSRVAEAFYWMGRYLERAYHQAYLIQVVETLETEELNSAERKLYRPVWNRLLPPLEKSPAQGRRSLANRADRYRLMLLPEPGSVVSTLHRAMRNAESIRESLSPEAAAPLRDMQSQFQRNKFKPHLPEAECARVALRLSEGVTRFIPQFFGIAASTMLADDGWRFCKVGQQLERGIITGNSLLSISKSLGGAAPGVEPPPAEAIEIELSAFLRLMGTRDAYRRVYQMRAEPIQLLELLCQNPQSPRSVLRCIERCGTLLSDSFPSESIGTTRTLKGIDDLASRIRSINWRAYVRPSADAEEPDHAETAAAQASPAPDAPSTLGGLLLSLLSATMNIHNLISDGFLSHQAYISQTAPSA